MFKLGLEGKAGKEMPESSRSEFLEMILGNNFALSDAEDNISGPLNCGGIADLSFLRALLAVRWKSWEPNLGIDRLKILKKTVVEEINYNKFSVQNAWILQSLLKS